MVTARTKCFRVNVRIDAALKRKLLKEAHRLSLSLSDVIRLACIKQYQEVK